MRIMITGFIVLITTLLSIAQSPTNLSGETQRIGDDSFTVDVPVEWDTIQIVSNFLVSTIPLTELQNVPVEELSASTELVLVIQNPKKTQQQPEITEDMSFIEVTDIVYSRLMASNQDMIDFGQAQISSFSDGRQLAFSQLTNDEQITGQLFLWSDSRGNYLVVMMMGNDATLKQYSETIDLINQSIRFGDDESSQAIHANLLWSADLSTAFTVYGQIAVYDDLIYVVRSLDQIEVYSTTGEFVDTIELQTDITTISLSDLVFDDEGNLWVVDSYNYKLWHITLEGDILNVIDIDTDTDNPTSSPRFVGMDSKGNIYTSVYRHTTAYSYIMVYNEDGQQLDEYTVGEHDAGFYNQYPSIEMQLDTLYVSYYEGKLYAYDLDGTQISNRIVTNANLLASRHMFVPVTPELYIVSNVSPDLTEISVFLYNREGDVFLEFDLFDFTIGYRFLENILPDPVAGYVDFVNLGDDSFVILNASSTSQLHAIEIVTD